MVIMYDDVIERERLGLHATQQFRKCTNNKSTIVKSLFFLLCSLSLLINTIDQILRSSNECTFSISLLLRQGEGGRPRHVFFAITKYRVSFCLCYTTGTILLTGSAQWFRPCRRTWLRQHRPGNPSPGMNQFYGVEYRNYL